MPLVTEYADVDADVRYPNNIRVQRLRTSEGYLDGSGRSHYDV